MKISYRDKIILILATSLTVWFIAVNAFIMLFIRNELVYYFKKNIDTYLDLYTKGTLKNLPKHIKITKKPISNKRYRLYGTIGKNYIFIKVDKLTQEVKRFATLLFLWELLLSVLILFIVYVGLKKLLEKQHYTEDFLRFILLAISHKLGNFLAAQKINMELANMDDESREKISTAMEELEKDFRVISSTIKSLTSEKKQAKDVNIADELKEIVNSLPKDKKIDVRYLTDKSKIFVNQTDFRIILSEIVSNAVKYSDGPISIEVSSVEKGIKFSFKNHIKNVSKGSGIGSKVVDFLCRKNNWIYTRKMSNNIFQATVIIYPKKKTIF